MSYTLAPTSSAKSYWLIHGIGLCMPIIIVFYSFRASNVLLFLLTLLIVTPLAIFGVLYINSGLKRKIVLINNSIENYWDMRTLPHLPTIRSQFKLSEADTYRIEDNSKNLWTFISKWDLISTGYLKLLKNQSVVFAINLTGFTKEDMLHLAEFLEMAGLEKDKKSDEPYDEELNEEEAKQLMQGLTAAAK